MSTPIEDTPETPIATILPVNPPAPVAEKPKGKRGRPPGSKNKPKPEGWVRPAKPEKDAPLPVTPAMPIKAVAPAFVVQDEIVATEVESSSDSE